MPTTDKLGREIRAGDVIVYGTLLGRSASLRIGVVREVVGKTLRVRGVGDGYPWRDPKVKTRDGRLLHPEERVVVISDLPLNPKYTNALSEFLA